MGLVVLGVVAVYPPVLGRGPCLLSGLLCHGVSGRKGLMVLVFRVVVVFGSCKWEGRWCLCGQRRAVSVGRGAVGSLVANPVRGDLGRVGEVAGRRGGLAWVLVVVGR